jgi:hypothetical protein
LESLKEKDHKTNLGVDGFTALNVIFLKQGAKM